MDVGIVQKTRQLVSQAQNGDASALGQLCSVYGERVRRMVRLRMAPELRSQLESMDLVQDALIAAVGGLNNFTYRHEGDFLRWLSQVAENRIRDHVDRLHAAKRDVRRQVRVSDRPGSLRDGLRRQVIPMVTTTPSAVLVRSEELNRLERAMDRLKDEYREVLLLAKIEGLAHKDIAERMNRSAAAVAKLLSRAIVALANEFESLA
ncbi:MAG: sigma-70 family RNA polymerase sigma factor [Sedimentisphaerales bacterium]|nr:sigma-70 family RNA polymerase sigma factor [Sedimentisphaerales bacterium]